MFFKYGGMNMKILASGDSEMFYVTIKRDRKSDPSANDVLERIDGAMRGTLQSQSCPPITEGYNEANSSWYVTKAKGEVLASRLNLVSSPRGVSYSSVLDAISAASRA